MARQSPVLRMPQTARAISALILREVAATHGQSIGGYAWAILEPVAGIALLSLIFSMAFAAPPLGQNFALFYATGFLPFMMYLDLSQKVSVAIRYNKPLLFYPGVTFLDALIARWALAALTHALVAAIVFGGLFAIYETGVRVDARRIAMAFALAACLGLGIGALNCALLSLFPTWERIWAVANRPLFIISSIFFLPSSLPEPYQSLILWNPLVHVIAMMRVGFYGLYRPDFLSAGYVLAVSGGCLFVGVALLRRHYRRVLNT